MCAGQELPMGHIIWPYREGRNLGQLLEHSYNPSTFGHGRIFWHGQRLAWGEAVKTQVRTCSTVFARCSVSQIFGYNRSSLLYEKQCVSVSKMIRVICSSRWGFLALLVHEYWYMRTLHKSTKFLLQTHPLTMTPSLFFFWNATVFSRSKTSTVLTDGA